MTVWHCPPRPFRTVLGCPLNRIRVCGIYNIYSRYIILIQSKGEKEREVIKKKEKKKELKNDRTNRIHTTCRALSPPHHHIWLRANLALLFIFSFLLSNCIFVRVRAHENKLRKRIADKCHQAIEAFIMSRHCESDPLSTAFCCVLCVLQPLLKLPRVGRRRESVADPLNRDQAFCTVNPEYKSEKKNVIFYSNKLFNVNNCPMLNDYARLEIGIC